ncbi:MAG TPA: efflux transporter outer membrane subunit [Steroidobacteraceae bacterium]|jgi:NodT family efflux transporter outer membrane factor (OMF) lipoprotein
MISKIHRWPPVIALLLLAACKVGPNYHRPDAPAASAYKEDQGWTPASPAQVPDDETWWAIYNDPVLDGLEKQVAVSNQTLLASEAAYRAAVAAVAIDRGPLFPDISVSGTNTRSGGASGLTQGISTGAGTTVTTVAANGRSRNIYSAGAQASWQLDVWGRIRRTVESDVAKAQASAADVAAARLSAQVTLAEDYFQLRAADEQRQLYAASIKAFQTSLTIAQNQVKAGVTTLADVYAAQTELESTEAADVSVELNRAKFEHAIAVLTGKNPEQLAIDHAGLAKTVPVVPAGLPSQLLQRRPDIAASERSVASANALIGVAQSAWYPNLTLSASYGFTATALPGLFQAGNSLWSFGPQIAETVFNGGARLATNRQARANYDEAVANYRATVLAAFEAVEDDLSSLRVLEQQSALQTTAVDDARKSEALSLNQYKAGIIVYTTLLTAQTARLSAEINLLSIQSQQLVASVDLVAQLGGGWSAAQLDRSDRGVPR